MYLLEVTVLKNQKNLFIIYLFIFTFKYTLNERQYIQ